VSQLSTTRNRFWRLPLSGCVADWKRCEYRPGMRTVAQSRSSGRCAAQHKFVERPCRGLEVPPQPKAQNLRQYKRIAVAAGLDRGKIGNGIAQPTLGAPGDRALTKLVTARASAVESAAASASHGVSGWALVWVSLSDSQLPWPLGSMLAWQSRLPLA
jgi:hypothetical protein